MIKSPSCSRPLPPLLVAFISGILAASWAADLSLPLKASLLALFVLSLLLIFLVSRHSSAIVVFSFFLLGIILFLNSQKESKLAPFFQERQRVLIEATLLEVPKVSKDGASRLNLMVNKLFHEDTCIDIHEKIRVTVYKNMPAVLPGQKLILALRLSPFRNFNNPGGHDFVGFMLREGFSCSGYLSDGRYMLLLGEPGFSRPRAMLEQTRSEFRQLIEEKSRDAKSGALMVALTLGERHALDQEIRDSFLKTGVGHLLAVSGLHMGMIGWLSFIITKTVLSFFPYLTLRFDIRKVAAILTAVPILAYCGFSGFQTSAVRAMIMAYVFLGAMVLGRENDLWSSLSLAALLLLAMNPQALFQASFQLSFLAVSGILWLGIPAIRWIDGVIKARVSSRGASLNTVLYILRLLCVSIIAWIFLFPVVAFYFHQISLIGVFANTVIIPIVGLWVLPAGLFSATLSLFSDTLSGHLLAFGTLGAHLVLTLVERLSQIPHASFIVPKPNWLELAGFYLLLFSIWGLWKHRNRLGLTALAFTLGFWVVDVGYWVWRVKLRDGLHVTYLDVGQGNATLVELPKGKKLLIDGGGFRGSDFDVGRSVVAPFLLSQKILKVHYLVLSHPQADHMRGLVFIARHFSPEEFWYNGQNVDDHVFQELFSTLKGQGVRIKGPSGLLRPFSLNGVLVQALHPLPETVEGLFPLHSNNASLVLKLSFNGVGFLFPGDIEREAEERLVEEKAGALASHVLLVPHHGSDTSSHSAFIREVRPLLAVISARDYRGNFPHKRVLTTLRDAGCLILRTDHHGAVTVKVSGGKLVVESFLKGRMDERSLSETLDFHHWSSYDSRPRSREF